MPLTIIKPIFLLQNINETVKIEKQFNAVLSIEDLLNLATNMKTILITTFFLFSLIGKAEKLDWTIMFYIASDEEMILQPIKRTIKEIERISLLKKLSNRIAVISQIDEPGEDKNFRYRINYVRKPSKNNIDSLPIGANEIRQFEPDFSYGEKDSGNPVTIKKFLNWSVKAFPAKNYILVLMGHSWGQQGMMQDFFVNGEELQISTMIKNYELRRVIEEVYRENDIRFKALVIDACSSAQLDVLLEYYELVDYIGASAIETPYNGIPWEDVLKPFFKAIDSNDFDLERDFFYHLVNEYVKSHLPGQKLALAEELADPTEFVVIRTKWLEKLAGIFKKLISSFPHHYFKKWQTGRNRTLELLSDADSNIDLLMFSKVVKKQLPNSETEKIASKLVNLLGFKQKDHSMTRTTLQFDNALGAWVTWTIDKNSKWDIAVCNIIKSFTDLNILDNQDIVANDEIRFSDCTNLYESTKVEIEFKNNEIREINSIFLLPLNWPQNPAFISKNNDKLQLSIWIDLLNRKKRKLFLRLPATLNYIITYLNSTPLDYIRNPQKNEQLVLSIKKYQYPLYVIKDSNELSPLYVVEAHSNGTKFKNGLGIFLGHSLPIDEPYYCGKVPIEYVEPYKYAWSIETYEKWFNEQKDSSNLVKCGFDFYRLHNFQELTNWIDFLKGDF